MKDCKVILGTHNHEEGFTVFSRERYEEFVSLWKALPEQYKAEKAKAEDKDVSIL